MDTDLSEGNLISHFMEQFILLFCVSTEKFFIKVPALKILKLSLAFIIFLVSGHLTANRCRLSDKNLADVVPVK